MRKETIKEEPEMETGAQELGEESVDQPSKAALTTSEVDQLIERVMAKVDYPIDPHIMDQIKRILRMPNILGQTQLMKFDDPKYLHLLVILMTQHPLSIVHTNLPLGFPTQLENVRLAYHLSLPLKVQVPLANGFNKYFTFKRSVIGLLIEPPVYPEIQERNKFATEAEYFAIWQKRKATNCPNITAFEKICRDFDVHLVMEAYSEHLEDGIYKASQFFSYDQ